MLQNRDMGGCGRVLLEDIDPRSDCHCLNTKIVEQIKTIRYRNCWHSSTAPANSFVVECRSWGDPTRKIHGAMCNVWPVRVIRCHNCHITFIIRAPFQNLHWLSCRIRMSGMNASPCTSSIKHHHVARPRGFWVCSKSCQNEEACLSLTWMNMTWSILIYASSCYIDFLGKDWEDGKTVLNNLRQIQFVQTKKSETFGILSSGRIRTKLRVFLAVWLLFTREMQIVLTYKSW